MHRLSNRHLLQLTGVCLAICMMAVPHYIGRPGHLIGQGAEQASYLSGAAMGIALVSLGFLKKDYLLRDVIQVLIICFGLSSVSLGHYVVSPENVRLHEVLQRAYYLPIIFAALWYGSSGGLLAAGLADILYIPHIHAAWRSQPNYQFNQYWEVALFFVFGGLTGVLSERQRKQRTELQESADRLSKAHAELQKSFESLRRADRLSAVGTLSAALAHEIRNPLSAMNGAIEILSRQHLSSERRSEFTEVIKREIARLNSLLYQFLEFAQPRPPVRRRTDIQDLAIDVCKLLSELATARRIDLILPKTEMTFPKIDADPDQIKQVMLNLVMNACEAMPDGGKVEIFLASEPDQITITIRDQGVGVSEQDLQHIFDPFYTTRNHGTGLGLSIAQRIMEQHGGRIDVKRNPKRGMTFALVFPVEHLANSAFKGQ
jgi:two-component system sensor histidine kinase HydH